MSKLLVLSLSIVAGLAFGLAPASAMQSSHGGGSIDTTGPGCTMDPFSHEYHCRIQVCHGKDKTGKPVCKVVTVSRPY